MKEATGELNMTVITVVAIAAVAGIFTLFVWPSLKASIKNNMNCANAQCPSCTEDTCKCTFINDEGKSDTVYCKNPDKE